MRDDPFSKLGSLDQKLFQSTRPPVPDSQPAKPVSSPSEALPSATTPSNDQSAEIRSREVGKEGKREISREVGKEDSQETGNLLPFDLNVKPYRKDSYLFTDEEFEAVEDLKLELRRNYEVKATKNDIARCAIAFLIADFRKNLDQSSIVKHLKTKK